MRIAIVSDVHGNRTAFEAVLADLRITAPDLVLHGGDLAGGAADAALIDQIRDLGWQGVVGNTDEMLFDAASLEDFAGEAPQLESIWSAVREIAAWTREALGDERVEWLRGLPRKQIHDSLALVHASPESAWRSPGHAASDTELESVYSPLQKAIVVYGHIHVPYVRRVAGMTVVNTGSVSLSYDGDRRAAYLLLDEMRPAIRRVEYDVDKEVRALMVCGMPHAEWIGRALSSASPQLP